MPRKLPRAKEGHVDNGAKEKAASGVQAHRSAVARWSRWLTVTGSVLIFASWVAQNHQQSTWADEKQRLMRSQLVLDIGEVRMEHWLGLFLSERAKTPPDKALLASYAYKLLQSDRNLAAWGSVRITPDPAQADRTFRERDELLQHAYKLYQKGETTSLVNLVERTLRAEMRARTVERDTQRFFDAVDLVMRQEEMWNRVFLVCYILGAALLGLGYVFNWRNPSAAS